MIAEWTKRLSAEAKRRAHVVEQQGALFVDQLQRFEEIEQDRRRSEEEDRREQARQQQVARRHAEERNADAERAIRLAEEDNRVTQRIEAFKADTDRVRVPRNVFEDQLAALQSK